MCVSFSLGGPFRGCEPEHREGLSSNHCQLWFWGKCEQITSLHPSLPTSTPHHPSIPPTLHSAPCLPTSQSFLTFNIGSVDSFERSLEQAQRELDLDPANWVPVTYLSEANLLKEVFKLAPTLIILGALLYFSTRVTGGMGSSGRGVRVGRCEVVYCGRSEGREV